MPRRLRVVFLAAVSTAAVLGSTLCAGCYRSHTAPGGTPGRPDAAPTADATAPDDGMRLYDGGCTPQLEVASACSLEWERAFGADDYGVYPEELVVGDDGGVFVQFGAPSGAQLDVDGERFGWGGSPILLALAPGGGLRWGRERETRALFGAHRDTVILERQDWDEASMSWVSSLEHADAFDGSTRSAELSQAGSSWIAAAPGDCALECASREARVLEWRDAMDLGPLGRREAPFGVSIVLFEDGIPRWDWTGTDDEPFQVTVVPSDDALATDGTLTLALVNLPDATDATLCLDGLPCLDHWQTAIVRFGTDGAIRRAFAVPDVVRSVSRIDDDLVVSANHFLARYDASGDARWTNDRLGSWVGWFAVDRVTGRLRGEVGIPHEPTELAGRVLYDCFTGFPWSPSHTAIVTADPSTGEIVSVEEVVRGNVAALRAHPEGGVVLALAIGNDPSVTLCGSTSMRDDRAGGPVNAVIAHLE